jgi:hypothetical protein
MFSQNPKYYKFSTLNLKGTSSTASALSLYIDSLDNYTISDALYKAMPMGGGTFAEYPDFFAFGFVLITIGNFKFIEVYFQRLES